MTTNDQPAVVPAQVVDEVLDAVPARPPRTRPVRFVLALLPFAVYVAPLWVAGDLASQRSGSAAVDAERTRERRAAWRTQMGLPLVTAA